MPKARDHYDILGVSRTATADEIRRAYRSRARTLHPDVNEAADAQERFAEVQAAYEVLSDPEKRKRYDRYGDAGVEPGFEGDFRSAPGGPGAAGAGAHGWPGGEVDFEDFSSIFEGIFGGRGPGRAGAARRGARHVRPGPERGPDVRAEVSVDFRTAILGDTVPLRTTVGDRVQSVDVRIPPGIQDRGTLRMRGMGGPGRDGGPPGDLLLTVRVRPHPRIRREGRNLLVDLPVSLTEAALGTSVTVPLLDGSIELKVPPGSSSGRKLRVRGRGVPAHGDLAAGDLLVAVQVVAPAELSDRARSLLEDLAGELDDPRADWDRSGGAGGSAATGPGGDAGPGSGGAGG